MEKLPLLGGIADRVMLKTLLTSFHETFEPGIIDVATDVFSAAEVPCWLFVPETLQNDANLFFGSILAVTTTAYLSGKFSCLCSSTFRIQSSC